LWPRDLRFLEVAATGRANAVITGITRHFKPRRGQHGVKICTPAEFVRSLPPVVTWCSMKSGLAGGADWWHDWGKR
jgi:hypothetical protein